MYASVPSDDVTHADDVRGAERKLACALVRVDVRVVHDVYFSTRCQSQAITLQQPWALSSVLPDWKIGEGRNSRIARLSEGEYVWIAASVQ
eukprot:2472225-Rhodomonas_salina.1